MTGYLELIDIHKDFSGLQVLSGVNLTIKEKERHALIGPNGAGKTTLFNIISGKYKPSSGSIMFRGENIAGKAPHILNRMGMARSFQITNVFHELTVFENVMTGVRSRFGLRYNFLSAQKETVSWWKRPKPS